MINRKISVHLQDFPDASFFAEEKELVENMDLVRAICSAALSVRDNKNLRVRLPLSSLTIIGKKANLIRDFAEIIAEEVNVKNIFFEDKLDSFAETKLQLNFKKIGAKFGSKIKEITACAKQNQWKKIADNEIEIAGEKLCDDDFEIKLISLEKDNNKFAIAALPSNDCVIRLDIEITQDLAEEGISRDIVRAVQQSRKDANLNVSSHIRLNIFCEDIGVLNICRKFSSYIMSQVLASELTTERLQTKKNDNDHFNFVAKIENNEIAIDISVIKNS